MISFLKSQYYQFKKNEFLFIELKSKILFLFLLSLPLYILYIPLVFIIILISPIILVRFGELESNRIGHLAGNTEIHILEKRNFTSTKKITVDVYFPSFSPICNNYLLKLWSRYLNIFPKYLVKPFYIYFTFFFKNSPHIISFQNRDRDVNNLLDRTESVVSFNNDEIKKGNRFLKKVNPENKKIVCFIIRDNSYLKKHLPLAEMSYHNYRDFDIENYIPALKMLIDLGYFVFRMGSVASTKLNFVDKNLIDLPFSDFRTEFLDIFIGSKCNFVLSTSTGWDAVPGIMFRKPMLICPMIPLGNLFTFSSNFMLTTMNFINSNNEKISQSEIFDSNLANAFESKDYINNGYVAIENSCDDICLAVKDFLIYLKNKNTILKHNKVFWKLYKKNILKHNLNHLHGDIKAVFSPSFIKNNKNLLQ